MLTVVQSNLPATIEDLAKFALIGREKLTAVRAEIRAIDRLQLARDVKEQKLQEAQDIADLVLDAETRIGELWKELPQESVKRTDLQPTDSGVGRSETTKQQARKKLGISEKQAEHYVKLANNPAIVAQAKAEARERGDIVTRQSVLDKVKNEEFRCKRETIKTVPPKPITGKYSVIYADPPWRYADAKTESCAIENHYPTMELKQIKDIVVPSEDNSVLFLWATAPLIVEALEVMQSWCFTYRSQMVWDKEKSGLGYWSRVQHDILLIGVKGKFTPTEPSVRTRSVYRERSTEHSKKPDYYYDLIESYFPGESYLELFARKRHSDKWTVWGNQVEVEPEVSPQSARVVDLFAGCGGMSLGFQNAGYEVVGAIELWDAAVKCHEANFNHPVFQIDLSHVEEAVSNITKLSPDIIIGSPPCQDFSTAGKMIEGDKAALTYHY